MLRQSADVEEGINPKIDVCDPLYDFRSSWGPLCSISLCTFAAHPGLCDRLDFQLFRVSHPCSTLAIPRRHSPLYCTLPNCDLLVRLTFFLAGSLGLLCVSVGRMADTACRRLGSRTSE